MVKPKATCTIEGCSEPHRCKGFCALHYERFLATNPLRPRCAVDGCEARARRGGFCNMHYRRQRNNGDALIVQTIRNDDAARLESYIRRLDNGCWEWTGFVWESGYARTSIGDDSKRAHIVMWERANGPVPAGMTLDHECHNEAVARGECAGGPSCRHRRCVNPDHLVPKSMADNQRAAKSARTHCGGGHAWTEESTQIVTRRNGTTYRQCRTCRRLRQQERRGRERSRPT